MRNVLRYVAYVLGSWLVLAVLVAAGFSVYTLLSGRAEPPESVAVVEEAEEEEVDPVLAVIEKLGKRISGWLRFPKPPTKNRQKPIRPPRKLWRASRKRVTERL